MHPDKPELPEDVRLVRTLMGLRNLTVDDVSKHTGLQIENLLVWMNGTASTLSHRSYIALLSYLGLTRDGFSRTFVQNWEMNAASSFKSEQQELLVSIAPWLQGAVMIEIIGKWQPMYGKVRVFAIRGDNVKILFSVKGGFRMPCALKPNMIPGVSYRTTLDNLSPELRVDPLYWNMVRNRSVTPAEFDDLFFETAMQCSWNDLRLLAREHGITPSMLAREVLAKEMHAYEQVDKEEAMEHAMESSSAKARRSAQSEKILVPAQAQEQFTPAKSMTVPLQSSRPVPTSDRSPTFIADSTFGADFSPAESELASFEPSGKPGFLSMSPPRKDEAPLGFNS